ncbi:MAG: hypothetical protein GF330_12395 [Candidatus Eisenbacteria bacterium]|nr:hypothetical protein [Candidatus Eisenbacteria bacterium]
MDPRRLIQESGGPPPESGEMSDDELLDAVAKRVVRMGLAVPAVFFLESTKPLSFVGSQVLVFLEPFVGAFLSVHNYQRFARLMEDRRNLETLIQKVEARDEEARLEEKQRKRETKERKAEAKRRAAREKEERKRQAPLE